MRIYSGNERVKLNENKAGQLLTLNDIFIFYGKSCILTVLPTKTFNIFLTHVKPRTSGEQKSIVEKCCRRVLRTVPAHRAYEIMEVYGNKGISLPMHLPQQKQATHPSIRLL